MAENPFDKFVDQQTIPDLGDAFTDPIVNLAPEDPGPQNQEIIPRRKPEPPTTEPPPPSPPLLVFPGAVDAVIQQESGGDPDAVSPVGAQGLMQLMPATAAELGVIDPFDPVQNRDGGTRYLQQQLTAFNDWELALMAYNWGPGNVQRWLNAGAKPEDVPEETRGYVANILPQINQMLANSATANPQTHLEVSETPADEVAEVQKLAAELKLPPTVVARNLPKVKRISAANKFTQFAPVTVKTLSEDPAFMAIAHDDAENMSAFEKKAGDMSFGTAFGRGIDLLQSLSGRFVEASGELFGAEEVATFGREAAERNEREAEAGGPRSKFVDIGNAGDFIQWLTETVGEQIPLMTGPLAGAAAGGALGALGGPAAPVTIPLGAVLGAFIPSLILGVGETQAAIKERDPDVEAPGVAFGAGAVIAALDSALPGKLGTRLVKAFGVDIASEVVKRIGIETAKRAVKGATLEGITEGIQTVVSEAAAAVATDTAIDPKALADEIIESVAAGFFLGFGTTTITETGGTAVGKYRSAANAKRQADKLNKLAVESKVSERDPAKRNQFEVKVLIEKGFEAVGVKATAILDWAQNHADGPDAALAALGTDAETVFAAEQADTDITVTAEQLAEHFLGNEQAYEIIANDLRMADGQETVSEAVAPFVEVAPDIKAALAKLEDIAPNLGERMAELVTVLEGGGTVKVAEALDKAPQNVREKLDELVAQVTAERVTVEEEQIQGRRVALEKVIADLDVKIEAVDVAIDEAEAAGRSHKTLDKRLDKLEQRRNKADEEQAGLPEPRGDTTLGATSDVLIPTPTTAVTRANERANVALVEANTTLEAAEAALARADAQVIEPSETGIEGFHATPHEFEEFDLETGAFGTGAEFQGHGVNIGRTKSVANFFADLFRREGRTPKILRVQANVTEDQLLDWDAKLKDQSDIVKRAAETLSIDEAALSRAEADLTESQVQTEALREQGRARGMTEEAIEKAVAADARVELDIAESIENARTPVVANNRLGNTTGRQFYRDLSKELGSSKAASAALNEQGVLGTTAKDADPVDLQGESSITIFDPANVQILERDGKPVKDPVAQQVVEQRRQRVVEATKEVTLAEEAVATSEAAFKPKPAARERGLSLKAKVLDTLEVKTTLAAVRALRKGFRAGRKITQDNFKILQDQALATVKASPLKGKQRETVLAQIAKVQTVERLEKLKTSILNRVEKQRQQELLAAVKKTLDKVVKVKGKLTPTVQTIVDSLSKTMKLSKDEAAAALDLREGGIEQVPGVQGKLENMILAALGRPDTRNSVELENLLLELHNLISDAKAIRTAGELIRAMEADNLRADTLAALGPEREVPLGDAAQTLLNVEVVGLAMNGAWATKLRRVFAADDQAFVEGVLERLSLFTEARVFEQGKIDSTKRLVELFQQRFPGRSESQIFKMMHKSQTETVNVGEFTHAAFEDEVGQSKKIVMKRSELRQRVMEMKNEKLNSQARHPGGNAYTDEIIQALEDALTADDVLMVDAILEFYDESFDRVNEVYERIYGYSLKKEQFYVPIRREFTDEKNDEFLNNIHFMNNINPSAIKTRQDSVRPLLAAHDMSRLQSHMMQMEYFIAFAEKVRLLNDVFAGDRAKVSGRIRANFGAKMLGTIKKDLEYFANRGILSSITGEDMWVRLLRNYSFAQLGISPQIGFKQLVSSVAYVENVKTTAFMAGVAKFLANPKKALQFLNENSQFFRNRGMNLDQDFADMVRDSNSFLGKRPTLTKWIMAPIRWGDRTAIAIGGFAHIQAAMKAGKTEEQAIRSFERISVDTQQSQDPDQVSELQRSNALMRVMAQFMSSANALARAEYTALVEAKAGRITKQELAKRLIVLHLIIPSTIQYIANAFHWDDDDQLRAAFLGAFNGVFIVGDLAEYAVGWAVGNESLFDLEIRHPLEFFTDIFKAIDAYGEDDISIEGFFEGIRSLDLALRVGAAKTGLPLNKFYNEVRGFADAVSGQPVKGGTLMLGYSPWIVDKFDIGN